jgi:coproporphyrinogen III oxidase-like Fe-S oxidoreductase
VAISTENDEFSRLLGTSAYLEERILKSRPTSISGAGITVHCPEKPVEEYLGLLVKELQQKKGYISSKQPVHDLRLMGHPLRQFGLEQLTELTFRLCTHFKIDGSSATARTFDVEPEQCQLETLALLKGLGFNHSRLIVDCDQNTAKHCLQALEAAIEQIETIGGMVFSVSITLSAATSQPQVDAILNLLSQRQSRDIEVHWKANSSDSAEIQQTSFLEQFTGLNDFLSRRGYFLFGDNSFKHPEHPDIALLESHKLRYGPWGFYSHKVGEWLGLGLGADGMIAGHLYHNTTNPNLYKKQVSTGLSPVSSWSQRPMSEEQEFEFIQQLYCDHRVEKRFFDDSTALLDRLLKRRWLVDKGASCHLTAEGIVNLSNLCKMYGMNF